MDIKILVQFRPLPAIQNYLSTAKTKLNLVFILELFSLVLKSMVYSKKTYLNKISDVSDNITLTRRYLTTIKDWSKSGPGRSLDHLSR